MKTNLMTIKTLALNLNLSDCDMIRNIESMMEVCNVTESEAIEMIDTSVRINRA